MKTIIITGAADGVGKEIAKLFSNEKLILIDEEKILLEKTSKELKADFYVCDVSNPKTIETIMKAILKENKKIDCLINCAGMWASGDLSKQDAEPFKKMNTLERMNKVVATNIFGTMAMIKSVFPTMKKQGYGKIININSQSGIEIEPMFPIYNASKTGANTFRKAIQADLAKHNIKITDICPGLIKTNFYRRAGGQLPKDIMDLGLEASEVAKTVKYVYDLPQEITIPSIEIRHIKNY